MVEQMPDILSILWTKEGEEATMNALHGKNFVIDSKQKAMRWKIDSKGEYSATMAGEQRNANTNG